MVITRRKLQARFKKTKGDDKPDTFLSLDQWYQIHPKHFVNKRRKNLNCIKSVKRWQSSNVDRVIGWGKDAAIGPGIVGFDAAVFGENVSFISK